MNLHSLAVTLLSGAHLHASMFLCRVWRKKPFLDRYTLREGRTIDPNPRSLAPHDQGGLDGLTEFEQLRKIAQTLFQLRHEQQAKVNTAVLATGLDLSKPYISVHFRRGDKLREAKAAPGTRNFITGGDVVKFLKAQRSPVTQLYVLTDDYTAVTELKEAAPEWTVATMSTPADMGFNECLLSSVAKVRTGACRCANISWLLSGAPTVKKKSFCFVNPTETDPEKLIPIKTQTMLSEADATTGILADVQVGASSVLHVAAGCGSNVDKAIQLLRTGKADTAPCLQTGKVCVPNVFKYSVWGINCKPW